jgi:hypothetical protein
VRSPYAQEPARVARNLPLPYQSRMSRHARAPRRWPPPERACSMWPVSVSRSCPVAKSQILIVRSAEPVTNHSLPASTAMHRTGLRATRAQHHHCARPLHSHADLRPHCPSYG